MLDRELCVSVKEESCFLCFLALIYVTPTHNMSCLDIYRSFGIEILDMSMIWSFDYNESVSIQRWNSMLFFQVLLCNF